MATRKEIYSEEYHQIMNRMLSEHPKFQHGMSINFHDFLYNLVFAMPTNKPITSEEIGIFKDTLNKVEKGYKLIQI